MAEGLKKMPLNSVVVPDSLADVVSDLPGGGWNQRNADLGGARANQYRGTSGWTPDYSLAGLEGDAEARSGINRRHRQALAEIYAIPDAYDEMRKHDLEGIEHQTKVARALPASLAEMNAAGVTGELTQGEAIKEQLGRAAEERKAAHDTRLRQAEIAAYGRIGAAEASAAPRMAAEKELVGMREAFNQRAAQMKAKLDKGEWTPAQYQQRLNAMRSEHVMNMDQANKKGVYPAYSRDPAAQSLTDRF